MSTTKIFKKFYFEPYIIAVKLNGMNEPEILENLVGLSGNIITLVSLKNANVFLQ